MFKTLKHYAKKAANAVADCAGKAVTAVKDVAVKASIGIALTVGGGAALAPSATAADVTLPSTGVDVGGYVSALVTQLGGVLGVAIGAGFALFAIWMGVRYVKAAIKGR